ncbi:IclR family transcriptional regulator [[Pseudomonas] boreopolis]|uniref:IclR family transcriptional regulator n=1 Tax=Xanthomonas boreopolis TaxID=86183 RepID=UPI003D9FF00C
MGKKVSTRSAAISQDVPDLETGKAGGGAQTLLRGLDVLEALENGPLGLAELSLKLGLSRSTTHRLASTLVERHYLTFRQREGYNLGSKLLELGHCAGQQLHLPRIARPYLEELAQRTEDTVHLGILDGDMALYLDKVEGRRRVSVGSRIGERHPIASTGLGKALVLDLDEPRWRALFQADARGKANAHQEAVWMERMRGYAREGYAFDLEENEDQIRCVAAPIRDVRGQVVAAISVASAAQYMDDARMRNLVPLVQATTAHISRELGWTGKGDAPVHA